jgi:hypothetical protein
MSVSVNIHKHSWIIDRDERHLDEMREWVVVTELREVLAVVHESIVSYSMWIGYKDVPMHWFSASGSSKHVWFFVLDCKTDEREGSKTFIGLEVTCMEGKEVKRVCIRVDPRFPQVERSLSCSFFFWCSWDNVR